MSIFTEFVRTHLDGHKDLTKHGEILELKDMDKVYIPLTSADPSKLQILVKPGDKVFVGTKIAARNDHFYVPYYSSVSGTVLGVQKKVGTMLKPTEHMVIENDKEYTKAYDLKPANWEEMTPVELADFMKEAGIVGLGGAGFPSNLKYRGPNIDTLLINGVECEPYATCDYRNMEDHLDLLLTGIRALKKMSDASNAYLCIKEDKVELIEKLNKLFEPYPDLEVKTVGDYYPNGWERMLVRLVLHKEYDKLPGEVGAIVQNSTTAIAFAQALTYGEPIVEKLVTFAGDGFKTNANVRVPVGAEVSEIVKALGGYTAEDVYLLGGGPMMGKTWVRDDIAITQQTGIITCLKHWDETPGPCMRCGKCTEVCPTGLQPVRINDAWKMKDLELMNKLEAMRCVECGCCSYNCPAHIAVAEGVRQAKTYMRMHAAKPAPKPKAAPAAMKGGK